MPRIIAHVDMDCFFCACEIKHNPSLEGKPVIVGATGKRGVVCAASYEAREKKVFSALPISQARAFCPEGIYLPVNMNLYIEESRSVMQILSTFADDMMQASVDEAYLDITTFAQTFTSLSAVGKHMREMVKEKTGLSCSIGIAHSRVVAKIASDFNKPAAVNVVTEPETFLAPLPIETFPGIGKVSKEHYIQNGIKTIGDLARLNRFTVLERFGMYGVRYHQIAKGEDFSGITHRGGHKSMSRERTFNEDVTDLEELEEALVKLCERVYAELDQWYFKRVTVKVRFSNFVTITRDYTLPTFTQSADALRKNILRLFRVYVAPGKSIRLLGVRVSKLSRECSRQVTLEGY